MSFPKSKILSPTSSTPVNHNVKQETNVNINLTERSVSAETLEPSPQQIIPPPSTTPFPSVTPYESGAIYPPATSASSVDPYLLQCNQLQSCVNFLKQVIHLIQSNPLIVSSVVIASQSDLANLIPLLVDNCTNVDIKIDEDSMVTCCQTSQYAKIDHILVTVDGELKNLKYQYPDVYSTFQSYNISLKFIRIDQ